MATKKPAAPKKILPPFALAWAWLGIFALAAGGLYAVILVGARSPKVQDLLPFADFFHTSLIVHVNLTVLVWMLSMTSMLWSFYGQRQWLMLRGAAFWAALLGTLLMAVAPFTEEGHPLLNNYVPILVQPAFLLGLSLFACGIALQTLIALADDMPPPSALPAILGLKCTAIITGVALVCFVLSFYGLKGDGLTGQDYYEHLFWAGGHTLQIAYTVICLVAWLLLAQGLNIRIRLATRWQKAALGFSVLLVVFNPLVYGPWKVVSAEHLLFFTDQMRWGGGISAVLIGVPLFIGFLLAKKRKPKPALSALIASFLLFTIGGALGFLISGANVVIPAHYHGSIVGVSLALMGVFYLLAPKLGARPITSGWGIVQPYLYGGGQLLHIAGLAWSGGYGTLRKTPGAAQTLEGQAAMGLMGFGGLLSIIGGIVFVVLAIRSFTKK